MSLALISLFCIGVAAVGCLYTVGALFAVRAFRERRTFATLTNSVGVTLLKPLHGAEDGLYENLVSFIEQDYGGPIQIVFGISDLSDQARHVVQRLMAAYPDRDLELVFGNQFVEGNAKIANLHSMSVAIKYDVLIMSDSDIRVGRRYVSEIADALDKPGVGLVTCLYQGGAGRGLWSRLSTMAIDFHFFPAVLLGLRLGKARPCMGATMALSRQTLDAIGGFGVFAGHLADDYAIGEAVRVAGKRVVVSSQLVEHRCNERSGRELFLHELRWARTIRSIEPLGFAGSVVSYPLPFAIAAVLSDTFETAALITLAATLLCRVMLQREVERTMGQATHRCLLGPLRDLLSFVVFCASFITDVVVWRGRRYRVRADGTLEELKGLTS